MTDKERINELREGIGRLTEALNNQWLFAYKTANEESQSKRLLIYNHMLTVVELLGGDWKRDEKGKHKIFIAGVTDDTEADHNED